MRQKAIKKSIDIQASREKIWDVLLNDSYTRIWYAEFSEGTRAETDWKEGSQVTFTDNSKDGMLGKIVTHRPNELLSIEFQGMIANGQEDYESEGAKAVKDTRETYRLSEKEGSIELAIESDMGEEYFESMSAAWDKALLKIKDLAEAK